MLGAWIQGRTGQFVGGRHRRRAGVGFPCPGYGPCPPRRNSAGGSFGVERLTSFVRERLASGLSAAETMRQAIRTLLAHEQGRLGDDASLLLLEWRQHSGEAPLSLP